MTIRDLYWAFDNLGDKTEFHVHAIDHDCDDIRDAYRGDYNDMPATTKMLKVDSFNFDQANNYILIIAKEG